MVDESDHHSAFTSCWVECLMYKQSEGQIHRITKLEKNKDVGRVFTTEYSAYTNYSVEGHKHSHSMERVICSFAWRRSQHTAVSKLCAQIQLTEYRENCIRSDLYYFQPCLSQQISDSDSCYKLTCVKIYRLRCIHRKSVSLMNFPFQNLIHGYISAWFEVLCANLTQSL